MVATITTSMFMDASVERAFKYLRREREEEERERERKRGDTRERIRERERVYE